MPENHTAVIPTTDKIELTSRGEVIVPGQPLIAISLDVLEQLANQLPELRVRAIRDRERFAFIHQMYTYLQWLEDAAILGAPMITMGHGSDAWTVATHDVHDLDLPALKAFADAQHIRLSVDGAGSTTYGYVRGETDRFGGSFIVRLTCFAERTRAAALGIPLAGEDA